MATFHYDCFEYSFDLGIWRHFNGLPPNGAASDSAWAYDEAWGLVMAGRGYFNFKFVLSSALDQFSTTLLGGRNESATLDTVMRTRDGVYFETLQNLPVARRYACLAIINSTHLFLAGGEGTSTMTYFYNGPENEWTEAGELTGCLNIALATSSLHVH